MQHPPDTVAAEMFNVVLKHCLSYPICFLPLTLINDVAGHRNNHASLYSLNISSLVMLAGDIIGRWLSRARGAAG